MSYNYENLFSQLFIEIKFMMNAPEYGSWKLEYGARSRNLEPRGSGKMCPETEMKNLIQDTQMKKFIQETEMRK